MLPLFQRRLVLPFIQQLRGEPIYRCLRELNESQWYSADRLRAMQWKKLRALVSHAYENVPFYRSRFDELGLRPEEVRSFDDYAKLPVLTKDDVRFNQQEIQDATSRRKVEHCRSGGTLGIPLTLVRDSLASAYARAVELRGFGWFGIRPGDKQVRIWGVPLDGKAALRERLKDMALNRVRLSPFLITPETVRGWHATMRRFGARYIYGYPSAIYRVCQIMDDLKLDGRALPIEVVACSAETLHEHQRERIEQTLDCRVIDEYGCSEMGPIALECSEKSLHLSMENIYTEFVEDSSGDGPPEILLTNLNSFTMPLLRYRIGDTGRASDTRCSCGRGLATMSFDAGRVLSMLQATDGSYVSGTLFCYIAFDIIKRHKGIRDFRVDQTARGRLEVTLVKDATYRDEILAEFTERVREKFGSETQIDYRFQDSIPTEASGKRLFVHSRLTEGS